jgi:hypothetical protein
MAKLAERTSFTKDVEGRYRASQTTVSPPPLTISRSGHSKSSWASSFIGSACTAFFTATAPRSCSRRQIMTRRYAGFAGS